MKKILAILLAAVSLLAVSCAGETEKADVFADLSAVVEKVDEFYGDDVTFVCKADEYSEDVLMFTYGLMDDKYVEAVEDFVLTECDGMSADTFAVVKFKDGTDGDLIEEAAEVMKSEYVEGLKKKLAAYNPEEFAASDGYKVEVYDNAIMMVISSANAENIIKAVSE